MKNLFYFSIKIHIKLFFIFFKAESIAIAATDDLMRIKKTDNVLFSLSM